MSAPSSCCCQSSVEVINVPGLEGEPGSYSFSHVDLANVTPNKGSPFAAALIVSGNDWMAVGQYIFIQGSGTYQVLSKPTSVSIQAVYLDVDANTESGNAIALNAQISPSGPPQTSGVFFYDDITFPTASPVSICINAAKKVWVKTSGSYDNNNWESLIA